jgi:hypothetical protein
MVWVVPIPVITGASGSAKTTLLRPLEAMEMPDMACFQCGAIYDDLPREVRADGATAKGRFSILGEALTRPTSPRTRRARHSGRQDGVGIDVWDASA